MVVADSDAEGKTVNWHKHPGVRTGNQLTRGERAADTMRNSMGSWAFVFGAIVFLGVWMLINKAMGGSAFDAYPYILLNLVLSCVAALQGAILLIAAKRSDQVSSELALHDYNTNVDSLQRLENVVGQVADIQAHLAQQDSELSRQTEALAKLLATYAPQAKKGSP